MDYPEIHRNDDFNVIQKKKYELKRWTTITNQMGEYNISQRKFL